MSRLRYNRKHAIDTLISSCPKMAALIHEKGAFRLQVRSNTDLFTALANSIIFQQLSGKAAATIYSRFEALFENNTPLAAEAAKLSVQTLRSAGLSNNKALSIIDLARQTCSGALPGPAKMSAMDDGTIMEQLCQVRGIGPWTAQMHLIFSLGRPDVMPASDLGIQKGVQLTYDLPDLPKPDRVLETTRHLSPYRSVASWYFWRAVDD